MFRDWRFVLVAAVSVGLWIPLTHLDWFQEFDAGAYVLRSAQWAVELRAGHLYPRWAPDLYGGYGEPLFVFFAPAVYAVSGLLTATFVDPVLALKLVALGGSLLSGAGAYALIHGETRQPDAALLGAIAYLAAPYRLGDLFDRGDFSEFCCIGLLPVVLALYLAAAGEARPFRARVLAVCAALAHAVMIVTHTILGLWGTILVGAIVFVRCVTLYRSGAWRRVLPLVVALGCAPGVAGGYVVPAMLYRDLTHTQVMVVGFWQPQNHWLSLRDLFGQSYLFARNFNQVGPFVSIAVATTVVGAALNFKRARPALAWLGLALVLVALTLPVGFGFWRPGVLPLAQFIQFPWRLLGPAVLFASVALGIGAAAATERRLSPSLKSGSAIAASAALLLLIAWPYASATPISSAHLPRNSETTRLQNASTTSADEFLPLAVAVRPDSPRGELVSATDGVTIDHSWSDGSRHALAVTATKPFALLLLSQYGFPGWSIRTRSGPASANLDTDSKGMLRVRLPNSGQYQLEVAYGQPPLAWLGFAVTGLALSILGSMLLGGSSSWRAPRPRWTLLHERGVA
jgi:hypothetical protein